MKELTASILGILQATMEWRTIRKKSFLLKAGHTCREVFFIRKGLVRCYYYSDEQEINACFMKENDWLVAIESFYEQTPSYEWFQAIEDTELVAINRHQLRWLLEQYPELNDFARVLTQHYYREWRSQLLALRGQPAMARYQWLLDKHPDLILRVPGKWLASWLGMAEVTFSKIRTAQSSGGASPFNIPKR